MIQKCRACGHVGRMKIARSFASNRTQDKKQKWICANGKKCLERQRKRINC